MNNNLNILRRRFSRILVSLLWCHVPIVAAATFTLGSSGFAYLPTAAATCLAGMTMLFWRRDPIATSTRLVSAVGLVGMAAILLSVFAGHPWQIDMHMYFFACLAVLVGWCDWRVILVAAATTAVHHLAFNLMLPALVFPGVSASGEIARVVLHAAIVLMETAVLIWVCRTVERALSALARSEHEAQTQVARTHALEREAAAVRVEAEATRLADTLRLAESFEAAVGKIVGEVSAAAGNLQTTASNMTDNARQTASQSNDLASSAVEVSNNVSAVASAAEELGASIQEIGRQIGESADLAAEAVGEADRTAILVQALTEAASRIGNVIGLISGIAAQTNLLALNATIEAARAGEAGRGFAVVAAEVKELAGPTARATDEISGQVGRIQNATEQAVSAIGSIGQRIRHIDGVTAAIAASVDEQGIATQEIVRTVSLAAGSTQAVTTGLGDVAGVAKETDISAAQMLASASSLSHQAEWLNDEVGRFLATIRAA